VVGVGDGVHVVGDVMYDALQAVRDRIEAGPAVAGLDVPGDEYVLATVHRAANTDDPARLRRIVGGLSAAPWPVVFPVHPRTVDALERHGLRERAAAALELIDPVGYLEFLGLIDGATAVATDSGGVQKEAFYLDTPCVTLRDETEWAETVEAGWNVLVGADAGAIARSLVRPETPAEKPPLYGDGDAATRIVEVLEGSLRRREEGARP
jgi:UDP-N-acetylglucosamine 2-epimerase (non-hydrolysing)